MAGYFNLNGVLLHDAPAFTKITKLYVHYSNTGLWLLFFLSASHMQFRHVHPMNGTIISTMILNFSKKINVISLKYDTLTNLTNSTLPL